MRRLAGITAAMVVAGLTGCATGAVGAAAADRAPGQIHGATERELHAAEIALVDEEVGSSDLGGSLGAESHAGAEAGAGARCALALVRADDFRQREADATYAIPCFQPSVALDPPIGPPGFVTIAVGSGFPANSTR